MATFSSDVMAASVPAKSGVRDTFRVPFTVSGTAPGQDDVVELAKVSIGHRVVGYFIESVTNWDSGSTGRVKLTYKYKTSPTSTTETDVITGSGFGTSVFGANTSGVGGAISQYGARNGSGVGIGANAGTFLAGKVPTETFVSDGSVQLVVTQAAGAGAAQAFSFKGFIEVQPG
jgi:hypothetical protein